MTTTERQMTTTSFNAEPTGDGYARDCDAGASRLGVKRTVALVCHLLCVFLCCAASFGDEPDAGTFRDSVAPFLKKYCVNCHGPDAGEAKLPLHNLTGNLQGGDNAETWHEVLNKLNSGKMPPNDEPQPPANELLAVVDWITAELAKAAEAERAKGSGIVLRRLNRAEYRNTIRDLTGLHLGPWFDPTARFTTDTATDGFDNVGSGLLVSDLHIHNYLAAARQIVDALVVDPDAPPKQFHWRVEPLYRQGGKYQPTSGDRVEREKHQAFLAAELHRIKPRTASAELSRFDGRIDKTEFRQGAKETKDFVVWDMRAQPPVPYVGVKDIAVRVSRGAGGCGTSTENAHRLIVRQFLHDGGRYRVRVHSQAFLPDAWDGPSPQMNFFLHPERTLLRATTLAPKDEYHEFEFYREGWRTFQQSMQQRSWGIEIGFPYQAGDKKNPIHWGGHVEWVEIEGPLYGQWPPESHRRVFLSPLDGESEALRAERILRQFMTRAFRRPVNDHEVAAMAAMHARALDEGATFEQAMKGPLVAVLCSPHFLYLVEGEASFNGKPKATAVETSGIRNADAFGSPLNDEQPKTNYKPAPLSDYELAARLSYFLWSSMPDDVLFDLASKGRLRDTEVLARQVRRMIADDRSRALIENFTGQWLGLRNLATMQPDPDLFPEFDDLLQTSVVQETQSFFAEILHKDLSVLNLLDSDFTMLNERLARHYGIAGVFGNELRRVALKPEHNRGGLLTQASVLMLGSDGFRTLPVNRGVFVLESILGDPPPPPPPNVGNLEDLVIPDADKLSTAKLLEMHRRNVTCAACHNKIDPWGMAFEAYDPVGSLRTHEMKWHEQKRRAIQGSEVTTSGLLADGRQLTGPDDVKRFLLDAEDEFLECLAEKMLAYALGRPATFADAELIHHLRDQTKQNGYRLRVLIEQIVLSDAFRTK